MFHRRIVPLALGLAISALCPLLATATHAQSVPPTHHFRSFELAQQSEKRDDEREAARLLVAADGLMTVGDLPKAVEAYEAVIASFPNSSQAATARRRILEARTLAKTPSRPLLTSPKVQQPQTATEPAAIVTAPQAPVQQQPVSPAALAGRLNEEFKAAVADRIFFAHNSAALAPADVHVLRLQAKWLTERKNVVVWLEARADDGETVEIDAALALERGAAVKSILAKEGVEPKRIRIEVLGRKRSVARCDDLVSKARQLLDPAAIDAAEACAAHNRTVIVVVGPEGLAYVPKIAENPAAIDGAVKLKSQSVQKAPQPE